MADFCEKVSDAEVFEISPSFPWLPSGTGSSRDAGRGGCGQASDGPGGGHPGSATQGKFPSSSLHLPGLLLKVWVLPEVRVLGVQWLRGACEAPAPRWLSVSVKRDRGGCPGLSTRPLRGRTGLHPQRAPRGCSRCPAPSASGRFHPRPCRLSPFPPGPVLGTTNLPSLWICQFCRLHTNAILLSVLFCD